MNMNLFDMFRKLKNAFAPCYLGRMWMCVVKCQPWSDPGRRYSVVIKNVGIVEAFCRGGETRVTSDERNMFNNIGPICLAGPVGRLEYVNQSYIWIGFFETEDKAKERYSRFADNLMDEIMFAGAELDLPG